MIKADYHLHSSFSHDSHISAEDIVKRAIELGISDICLTEHKDLAKYYKYKDFYKDEPINSELERLRNKYSAFIKIKKGVELDFQSETTGEFEEFLDKFKFDYVIGSVHALEYEFVGEKFFKTRDPHKAYHDYFNEVLSLSELKSFDCVGHLDYIKRFGSKYLPFDPDEFSVIIDRILSNLIKNGRGIELNISGYRHSSAEPYPAPSIVKKFRDLGGEIITIGSDAHRAKDIGHMFYESIKLLIECGFDGYYVFNKRIPEKVFFN